MVCAKTTVLHESGLHMRPAQEFVSAVANYPCKVIIKVGEKSVNGKSILSVMAAGIKRDTPIEICCDGPEEQQALVAALKVLGRRLNFINKNSTARALFCKARAVH